MKKLLIIALVALVSAGMLFAQAEGETAAAEETAEATGPVTVNFWRCFTGNKAQFFDRIIEEFNASQDKYVVVPEYNGSYIDQFAKFMATDEEYLPALITTSGATVGSYLNSDYVRPAQDFIDTDPSWDYNFYPNLVSAYGNASVDKVIGVPNSFSLYGVFYNVDILEKAGIDPKTLVSFDAIYEAAIKLGEGGFCKYPLGSESTGIFTNIAIGREGYYTVNNNNGLDGFPTKCLYGEGELYQLLLKYYGEWKDLGARGYIYPLGSKIATEVSPALATGDVAMIITTSAAKNGLVDACSATGARFSYIPLFSLTDAGKRTGIAPSGNGFFIINNGNEEAQRGAYEFIKYFLQVPIQIEWNALTGYMPVHTAITNSEDYKAVLATDDYTEGVLKMLESDDGSVFHALIPNNNSYTPPGTACLNAVVNGTDPAQAIAEMVATINEGFDLWNKTNAQ